MFCKHCGSKIDDDSVFCSICGKFLISTVTEDKNSISNDSMEPSKCDETLNVKIIRDNRLSENSARKIARQVATHLLYAAFLVLAAFIIKSIAYNVAMSTDIPVVTEEDQANFNDEFFKLEYPNGLPSFEELKANNGKIDHNKYPHNHNFPIGIIAMKYLKLGNFKYDDQINSENQLKNINESREEVLDQESKELANTVFNISLMSLVGGYFLILFLKWLFKKE